MYHPHDADLCPPHGQLVKVHETQSESHEWVVLQWRMSVGEFNILKVEDVTMSQEAFLLPSSVCSLPLPPYRRRKVMTTPLIIISSIGICLTASLWAQTPTHSDSDAVRRTHTIFPPILQEENALLIQRREGSLAGSIYNSYVGKHWLLCVGM